jgi:hypothetical protein
MLHKLQKKCMHFQHACLALAISNYQAGVCTCLPFVTYCYDSQGPIQTRIAIYSLVMVTLQGWSSQENSWYEVLVLKRLRIGTSQDISGGEQFMST